MKCKPQNRELSGETKTLNCLSAVARIRVTSYELRNKLHGKWISWKLLQRRRRFYCFKVKSNFCILEFVCIQNKTILTAKLRHVEFYPENYSICLCASKLHIRIKAHIFIGFGYILLWQFER